MTLTGGRRKQSCRPDDDARLGRAHVRHDDERGVSRPQMRIGLLRISESAASERRHQTTSPMTAAGVSSRSIDCISLGSYIAQCDSMGVDVFQAVADPVRRSIVERLADAGEASAGQLAELARAQFGISQPTTSKHLKVLREAGLVTSTVAAQRRVYRLDPRPLSDLAEWATRQSRYWNLKLDALEQHLLDQPTKERP